MTDVATRPSARPAVRWRLCGAILRTSLGERLAYRGDFIFGTAVRFLPIVTQVFLWGAVYQASSVGQTREINGYTYGGMVSYFLLAMVARAFSSMPGLASGIGRDVRDGSIKKFLVQPLDLVGYLFWTRVAHKLVYYLTALLPFLLVFWLCADFLPAWPGASVFAAGCVAMLLGFVVGFLVDMLIGLLSFWFLEVSSLLFIYMAATYFLSGHMLPLDWLPGPLGAACELLPFRYLAYFPAAVFLGKYTAAEAWTEIGIELIWVAVLLVCVRTAYVRGVRRYGAFGG